MSARSRTCPECGQRWAQRDARYCGWCGSPLGEVAATRRRRTSATVAATRALAAVGLGGLLVITMSLDLDRFEPEPDPTVDLEPEPPLADSPLSQEEISSLQAQADPDRLRCEPRGCELWRLALGDGYAADGGVVHLDNGLLVIRGGDGAWRDLDDGAVEVGARSPVLFAVDPTSGQEAWSFPIALRDGDPVPWVQLTPGPHGALVLAGTTVISLDQQGEQVWRWELDDADHDDGQGAERPSHHPGEVWGFAVPDEDLVVLHGATWPGVDAAVEPETDAETDEQLAPGTPRERRFVTVLEADTGEQLWSRAVAQSSMLAVSQHSMPQGAFLVIDTDGTLQRLDPRTGEVLWQGPEVGEGWISHLHDWAVVHGDDGVQRVFDAETGAELGGFGGQLVHGLRPAGDGAVGVLIDSELGLDEAWDDETADLALLHLDADGSVAWTAELGTHTPWWGCCHLLADLGDGTVSVAGEHEVRDFDLATGEMLEVRSVEDPDSAEPFPATAWEAAPGVRVWWQDGHRVRIETDEGEATVRSRHYLQFASFDPLVIADDDHLLGIRIPDGS